jgi:preprotein translocase subunit SecD
MKKMILFFIIITSTFTLFSQTKTIESGLYLVLSRDSCSNQSKGNTIVYLSDSLCLEKNPIIDIRDIDTCFTATANLDGNELFVLNVALNKSAKLKFKKITEQNVGKKMAMIIDQKVVMAAVIRDPITSGRLTISGDKEKELKLWADKLQQAMREK